MNNSKFFYYNLVTLNPTELTLVAGSPDAFYPVSNLKNPHTTEVFRTSDASNAVVLIDCQTPKDADSFLIVGDSTQNLAVNAITIEANATADFTDPAFSTTVEDFDFNEGFASCFFESQRYRYWRITFAPTSSYVEVGCIFLGEAVQMASNSIALGWEFRRRDLSRTVSSRYGQRFTDKITDQKTISASIENMDADEFEAISDMFDYCGTNKPLWVVIDPDQVMSNNPGAMSGYFFITEDRPAFTNPFHALYSTSFILEEGK